MRLSVHCLATSLASRVTSSDALAMSLAHWMRARLLPLPPLTRRDISAMSSAMRFAAAMMSFPCTEQQGHCSRQDAGKSPRSSSERLGRNTLKELRMEEPFVNTEEVSSRNKEDLY